jgi:hypothetical protein
VLTPADAAAGDDAGSGAAGAVNGADSTDFTGARAGGAAGSVAGADGAGCDALSPEAACNDALAWPGGMACGCGGGGGDKLPLPNRPGDALDDDGSGSGAASAVCCALVRSETNASVRRFISSLSGGVGRAGTVARFG